MFRISGLHWPSAGCVQPYCIELDTKGSRANTGPQANTAATTGWQVASTSLVIPHTFIVQTQWQAIPTSLFTRSNLLKFKPPLISTCQTQLHGRDARNRYSGIKCAGLQLSWGRRESTCKTAKSITHKHQAEAVEGLFDFISQISLPTMKLPILEAYCSRRGVRRNSPSKRSIAFAFHTDTRPVKLRIPTKDILLGQGHHNWKATL